MQPFGAPVSEPAGRRAFQSPIWKSAFRSWSAGLRTGRVTGVPIADLEIGAPFLERRSPNRRGDGHSNRQFGNRRSVPGAPVSEPAGRRPFQSPIWKSAFRSWTAGLRTGRATGIPIANLEIGAPFLERRS